MERRRKLFWDQNKKTPICGTIWELLLECSARNCNLDVTEKEKEAMTCEETVVVEGNKTADELTKDGAEVDGRATAAAKALTIKQLRKDIYASIEYAAHFHQVEEWKDREQERTHLGTGHGLK